jgi:uncharacterized protein YxjI
VNIDVFSMDHYVARRKVFKILGGAFTIHEPENLDVVAYVRQKAFKLKEDITVFTDDSMGEELMYIRARQIIDFAASYDVFLPGNDGRVGTLRRKGFSSILRDQWEILDAGEAVIGRVLEDSTTMALLRRFLSNLIPQNFRIDADGREVGSIHQFFNPFVLKYEVDFRQDAGGVLDRRLGVAVAVLLLAIEGRQQ